MKTILPRISVFRASIVLIVLSYLVLISGYPIFAITNAGHDDALFMRGLENISGGRWLGAYDNLTLAKGPLISMMGAIGNSIGLQAMFMEALLYAASVVAVAFWRGG